MMAVACLRLIVSVVGLDGPKKFKPGDPWSMIYHDLNIITGNSRKI